MARILRPRGHRGAQRFKAQAIAERLRRRRKLAPAIPAATIIMPQVAGSGAAVEILSISKALEPMDVKATLVMKSVRWVS